MNKVQGFFQNEKLIGLIVEILVALYCFLVITIGSIPVWHYLVQACFLLLSLILIFVICARKEVLSSIQFLLKRSFVLPFAAFVVLSSLVNFPRTIFSGLLTFLFNVAGFFVVLLATRYISSWERLFLFLLVAFTSFMLVFMFHYREYLFRLDFSSRLGGDFGNENDVGMALGIGFALTLIMALFQKKYWTLIFSPFFCLATLMTGSRKALIIVAVSAVFLLIYRFRHNKKALLVAAISLAVFFAAMFALPAARNTISRFLDAFVVLLTGGDSQADASAYQRLLFLESSFYYGCQNPFFGNGFYSFQTLSGYGYYSHNTYGEVFCDFGVLALGSYLFFLLLPLRNNNKYGFLRTFSILISLLYFVLSFFLVILDSKTFFMYFAIAYGSGSVEWSLAKGKANLITATFRI